MSTMSHRGSFRARMAGFSARVFGAAALGVVTLALSGCIVTPGSLEPPLSTPSVEAGQDAASADSAGPIIEPGDISFALDDSPDELAAMYVKLVNGQLVGSLAPALLDEFHEARDEALNTGGLSADRFAEQKAEAILESFGDAAYVPNWRDIPELSFVNEPDSPVLKAIINRTRVYLASLGDEEQFHDSFTLDRFAVKSLLSDGTITLEIAMTEHDNAAQLRSTINYNSLDGSRTNATVTLVPIDGMLRIGAENAVVVG